MSKTFFRAVLLVAGFSVLTRLFGFLFRIYLSRELGAELLGVYQVAFSVFMVLVVLVSSGLPLAVSKLTATYRVQNNIKSENSVTSSALIIGLVTSLIICTLLIVFRDGLTFIFTDSRCILILLTLLPAVVASAVYSAFRGALWGTRDYFSVCWTELAEQLIRIVAFFVLANIIVTSLDGATLAGWAMTIGCVASAILVAVVYFKTGKKLGAPKHFYKPVLRSATPVTGVRTASTLIQPLIAVLFPLMMVLAGNSNEDAMSLYGMAMGMTFPLLFLPSTAVGALSFTLIPELSTSIAQKEHKKVEERVKSALLFAILISCMVLPLYMGAGEKIGEFLYANTASGIYLSKAAWIMLPLGLSNITSSILNAYNLEFKSFINNIIGGIVLILFVVLGSGTMGIDSLIWGFGGCMMLTTILNIRMIKINTTLKFNLWKPMLLMFGLSLPCALLTYWTMSLILPLLPLLIALVLAGGLGIVAFLALCWTFKLVNLSSLIVKFTFGKKKTQNLV